MRLPRWLWTRNQSKRRSAIRTSLTAAFVGQKVSTQQSSRVEIPSEAPQTPSVCTSAPPHGANDKRAQRLMPHISPETRPCERLRVLVSGLCIRARRLHKSTRVAKQRFNHRPSTKAHVCSFQRRIAQQQSASCCLTECENMPENQPRARALGVNIWHACTRSNGAHALTRTQLKHAHTYL